ncbi:MAG: four helix bundle protein [Nitrospiria bacterium]
MKSYKDLKVYQEGYKLSLDIYKATKKFPEEEKYGIVSQMRRSSVSIPCNIAEGYRRKSRKEYVQFLHIAIGSCSELETLISLSRDLKLLKMEEFDELNSRQTLVSVMLMKLIKSLSQNTPLSPDPPTPLLPDTPTRLPPDSLVSND